MGNCFRKKEENDINCVDKLLQSVYDPNKWIDTLDKSIELKDTIPFVPPVNKGVVIKVYDGDTITIAAKLPYAVSPIYRFSVRLNGIDCPEMKTTNAFEKDCAVVAKNFVAELAMNRVVTLKNVQTEKYGRILADVYVGELHINKLLVEKRLAIGYDGGTKPTFKKTHF